MLGRLFRVVVIGGIASMIAAAFAGLSVKRRVTPTTDESADEITAVAVFGPLAFHSTATAFRGGVIECWYGGGVLDLRDAVLAPEGATLKVRAVFGGGQLIVPPSWKVISHVTGLGGIQDIRPAQGHAAIDPELVIEGTLIGGGFAVTSELNEDEDAWLQAIKDQQTAASGAVGDAAGSASDAVAKAETGVAATAESAADSVSDAVDTAADKAAETVDSTAEAAGDASEEMAPAS